VHVRVVGVGLDVCGDPVGGVEPASSDGDVCAAAGQGTRRFDADAGSGAGDDDTPAGQVDA
jgi:hypothetical protein